MCFSVMEIAAMAAGGQFAAGVNLVGVYATGQAAPFIGYTIQTGNA